MAVETSQRYKTNWLRHAADFRSARCEAPGL